MRTLEDGIRADEQLWGRQYAHAMNISDEIVTGQEGLGGPKADVWGVSTAMYKLRPLATIGSGSAIVVPEDMLDITRQLNAYQNELGVNVLSDDRIVPVENIPGLGYSQSIVHTISDVGARLKALSIQNITGFIESSHIQEARRKAGFIDPLEVPHSIVDRVNSKGIFLNAMERIGVPVAYGKTLYSADDAVLEFRKMINMGAKTIYAKLSRAASGQWVFAIRADDENGLIEFLGLPQTKAQMGTLGIRIDYGIEGIIDSPNVMVYVGKSRQDDRFVSASSQLLAKRHPNDERATVHKGNISGIDPQILERLLWKSQKVADWMRNIGAYGIVGLDYVITKDQDIFIMEANYRVNGGLAAAMKWHDLKSPYWAANGGTKVPKGTSLEEYISHIQRNRVEYDGKSGVIILNPATSPAWSIQIAVLGQTKWRIMEIMQAVDMI